MIKNTRFFLLLFTLFHSFAWAQEFQKEQINSYINTLDNHDKFMGVIELRNKDSVIFTKSIGYSNWQMQAKNEANTKFRIGSISKSFTAVLVLQSIEENKLSLETPLSDFYPEIENAASISISDLLYHRSGIANFTALPDYLNWHTVPKTEEELINIIKNAGNEFAAGEQFSYSNSNYVLLSFILEKVNNKPYAILLKEKICNPLSLEHTYLGGTIDSWPNEAYSYTYLDKKWQKEEETNLTIPIGAGGIVSNASDLSKFIYALFNEELITKESIAKMIALKDGVGTGIFPIPYGNKISWGHTCGIDGIQSILTYFDHEYLSLVILSNGSNYSLNNIAINVLAAYFGDEVQIPEFSDYQVKSEELKKYIGTYSNELLPIKITISQKGNQLIGQASGQGSFNLEPFAKNVFINDFAGIKIHFNPEKASFILYQNGMEFIFTKE